MTEPKCVPGLLRVHAKIDQVDENLHLALWLLVAAHHTEREDGPTILRYEPGDDCIERPFVRFERVGVLGIEAEKRSAVLQGEPQPR